MKSMIDERMENAYKKGIEQLKQECDALKEDKKILTGNLHNPEIEVEKLRAQMEIVRLFLGGSNR